MDFAPQLALSLISGIVVALVASYVTVRLSLRRFYSEKWWKRKAQAYSEIIEALYDVKNGKDKWLDENFRQLHPDDQNWDELDLRSREGWDRIERTVGIGAFIISDEALRVLTDMSAEWRDMADHPEKYFEDPETILMSEVFEREANQLGDALSRMRKIAKDDLKVKSM